MRTKILACFLLILGLIFNASTIFAADAQVTPDFTKAWQEAASSQAYSFSCKVSSAAVKVQKVTLSEDQQKMVDLTIEALKRYTAVSKGSLLGAVNRLFASESKLNTLWIADSLVAGAFPLEEAIQLMEDISKTKVDILLDGDTVYYNIGNGWKTFESADFTKQLYDIAVSKPFTVYLEKASFALKTAAKGKSKAAVYNGTLTADETVTLLTPFMGEEEAKKQPLVPTKLYITGSSHIQKYDSTAKVVLGGLSFTVKEKCMLSLKAPVIKIPSGATATDVGSAMREIGNIK